MNIAGVGRAVWITAAGIILTILIITIPMSARRSLNPSVGFLNKRENLRVFMLILNTHL